MGIGTSSPTTRLSAYNTAGGNTTQFRVGFNDSFAWDISRDNASTGALTISNSSGGALIERMRITGAGNVGIGTTSPNTLLTMVGTTGKQAILRLQAASGSAGGFKRAIVNFRDDTGAAGYDIVNQGDNANTLVFSSVVADTATVRMALDSSGNLIQTVNTTAATLATNGTLTFSIVDNSTLRISVRGSDGTTRTATVALT
jgi:hypothetical protein